MNYDNNNYYILTNNYWGVLFIPEKDLEEIFEFKDKYTIKFKKLEWGLYSGGEDTYLQNCNLYHARSGIRTGKWQHPKNIIGAYFLEFE